MKQQIDEQQNIANQGFKCKICDKDFESESDQISLSDVELLNLMRTLPLSYPIHITIIHNYLLQTLFNAIHKIKE